MNGSRCTQIGQPRQHRAIDPLENMLEGFSALAVRIGNVDTRHPTIQQHDFSARLGCHAHQTVHVLALHGQNQIRIAQHRGRNLACAMFATIHVVFFKNLQCRGIHRLVDKRAQAGALDGSTNQGKVMTEQVFSRRTTADVPYADDQYPFEHNDQQSMQASPLPKGHPRATRVCSS